MKQFDLVEIVWDDARSLPGWHDDDSLGAWRQDHKTRRMQSVGYVYDGDDKTICILGTVSDGDPVVYADALEIPRAMIKRIKMLRRSGGGRGGA